MKTTTRTYVLTLNSSSRNGLRLWMGDSIHALRHCSARLAGLFKAGLNIRPVLTHTFPLKDFAQGFELIKSGQCGKVVLFP